jgi:diguanylate cyclase (GGDEF)-like protein/PAS domain S-box-containing protein
MPLNNPVYIHEKAIGIDVSLADSLSIGLFFTDIDGKCLYANSKWLEITGLTLDEALGKGWINALHPDDREPVLLEWNDSLKNNQKFDFEFRFQRNGKTITWVLGQANKYHNEDVSGYVGTITDITESKNTEASLHQLAEGFSVASSSEFFHSFSMHLSKVLEVDYVVVGEIVDDPPDIVKSVVVNNHGNILEPLEYALQGTPCETVIGKSVNGYESGVQNKFPNFELLQVLGAEGYVGAPLFDSSKKPIGIIAVLDSKPIENIRSVEEVLQIYAMRASAELERKQSEEELHRYNHIMSTTPDMVAFVDRNYTYRLINDSYLSYLKKKLDEVIGKHMSEIVGMEKFEIYGKPKMEKCFEGEPQSFQIWFEYPEQGLRYIDIKYNPYFNFKEEITGGVVSIRDITDLKTTEDALVFKQLTIDRISEAIFWTGKDKIIYDVNDAACASLGYTRDELLELNIHDLDPDFPVNGWEEHWEKTKKLGRKIIESKHKRKNGEIFPVEVSVNHIEYGGKEYHCSIVRDITKSKAAEEELKSKQFTIENMSDYIVWVDINGMICEVNQVACQMLGYTREELLQLSIPDIDPSATLEGVRKNHLQIKERKNVFESFHKTKDGKLFPVEITANHIEYGGKDYHCCIVRDITERKQNEVERENYLSLQNAILEATADGILVVNNQGEVASYNQQFIKLWGIIEEKFVMQDSKRRLAFAMQKVKQSEEFLNRIEEIYNDVNADSFDIVELLDGRILERYSRPQRIGDLVVGRVWSFRDVTEKHKLSEQLTYQANHDPLTGLVNRREFEERLERILSSLDANSVHAMCYMDLDNFKQINDVYGHVAGDYLLKNISDLFHEQVRGRDTLARLGGDEFGLIMEHCSIEQAKKVADNFIKVINECKLKWEDKEFNVGVSIGLLKIDYHCVDTLEVMKSADIACYTAKKSGRNCVHVSPD